jgi:hypothetical protein
MVLHEKVWLGVIPDPRSLEARLRPEVAISDVPGPLPSIWAYCYAMKNDIQRQRARGPNVK